MVVLTIWPSLWVGILSVCRSIPRSPCHARGPWWPRRMDSRRWSPSRSPPPEPGRPSPATNDKQFIDLDLYRRGNKIIRQKREGEREIALVTHLQIKMHEKMFALCGFFFRFFDVRLITHVSVFFHVRWHVCSRIKIYLNKDKRIKCCCRCTSKN